MTEYLAVEGKWPYEPRTDYPEFNDHIIEIDERGNRSVICQAASPDMARRIAAAMHNCDYGEGRRAVEGE